MRSVVAILGDMRIVEEDRDDRGMRIADQHQQLLALVGASQRLALAERQGATGGLERSLGCELTRELVLGHHDRRRRQEQPRDRRMPAQRGGLIQRLPRRVRERRIGSGLTHGLERG